MTIFGVAITTFLFLITSLFQLPEANAHRSKSSRFRKVAAASYTYEWKVGDWGACSARRCDAIGTQKRSVDCIRSDGRDVRNSRCDQATKPASSQSCKRICQPPVTTTTLAPPTTTLPPVTTTTLAPTTTTRPPTTTTMAPTTTTMAPTTTTRPPTTTTQPPVTTTTQAPPTTTLPPVTTTTLPPTGNAPITIYVTPSFETAGVIITLPSGAATSVSAKVFFKKQSESSFRQGHDFVRYDGNNMGTSLFDLVQNTAYDLQVQYTDASGATTQKTSSFTTRRELTALPAAVRTVNVNSTATLNSAISAAQPGDHIVLANAVYGPISISKKGTAANPIVIRGATAFDQFNPPANSSRAIIDGNGSSNGINFSNAAYVIIDNVEVRNGGSVGSYGATIYIRGSSNITVQNSFVHDGGYYNILVGKGNEMSGDINQSGYHLIQNNHITDVTGLANCQPGNDGCSGVTYYGISQENNPGAGTVIRKNRVYGHTDNIRTCGNEDSARSLQDSVAHVLRLTSSSGTYLNHDTEVYDNESYWGLDDDIETDGICVNLRIFRNRLGKPETNALYVSKHALTIAPTMPGPIFVVRNIVQAYKESAVKLNTAGGAAGVAIRNVYIYHNTFNRSINNGYAILNLWYGVPGDHDVPVKNFHFRNNIFNSTTNTACTDYYAGGSTHPTFNYNLWNTPSTTGCRFEWHNGSATTIQAFRTLSGQELNGLYGNPMFNQNFEITNSSPAIDKALRIPGINDYYNGAAPDIGATEY